MSMYVVVSERPRIIEKTKDHVVFGMPLVGRKNIPQLLLLEMTTEKGKDMRVACKAIISPYG